MGSCLQLVPDSRHALKNVLYARCPKMDNPHRSVELLQNQHIAKRVFFAAPSFFPGGTCNHEDVDPASVLDLASVAEVLVVQSIAPGRSYYSIFVEGEPKLLSYRGGGQQEQPTSHHQHHQLRLFQAAITGILALPPHLGPGRLAFAGIPGYAAPVLLEALRAAGYDNLYDEPCFRYSLTPASSSPAGPPDRVSGIQPPGDDSSSSSGDICGNGNGYGSSACGRIARGLIGASCCVILSNDDDGAAIPTPSQPPQLPQPPQVGARTSYVLDSLRTEADAQLVDRHWTYRSPYSLRLVRMLIAHHRTVCVRVRPSPLGAPSVSHHAGNLRTAAAATASRSPVGMSSDTSDSTDVQLPSESAGKSSDAVAWVLQCPDGSLGMAHTLEGHRRRGLMRACVAEVVRQVAAVPLSRVPMAQTGGTSAGGDVGARGSAGAGAGGGCGGSGGDAGCCGDAAVCTSGGGGREGGGTLEPEIFSFVVLANTASARLFESLGFRRCPVQYHWLGVEGGHEGHEDQADGSQEPAAEVKD